MVSEKLPSQYEAGMKRFGMEPKKEKKKGGLKTAYEAGLERYKKEEKVDGIHIPTPEPNGNREKGDSGEPIELENTDKMPEEKKEEELIEGGKEIRETLEKQELEKRVKKKEQEEEREKIKEIGEKRKEKIGRGKEKIGITKRILIGAFNMSTRMRIKTQRLLNISSAGLTKRSEIEKQVIKDIEEEIKEGKETEYRKKQEFINEIFSKTAENNNVDKEQRERLRSIVENKSTFDRFMNQPIVKKVLDHRIYGNITTGVLIGGASTFLGRSLARNVLNTLTFGAGGAIVGGTWGFFRERRKAVEAEYNAEKWAEELESLNPNNPEQRKELEATIEAMEKRAIEDKKIKGKELEALTLLYKIREKKLEIKKATETEEKEPIKLLDAIDEIKEETPVLEGRAEEIYKKLLDKKKKAVFRKARNGALIGATIGGVAAGIGALIHLGGEEAIEETITNTPEPTPTVPVVLGEINLTPEEAGLFLSNEEMGALLECEHIHYFVSAERGEGTIHLARKALHDFLLNQNILEEESGGNYDYPDIDKVRFLYAARQLSSQINGNDFWISKPGETFSFNGEQIKGVLEEAKNLSGEELEKWEKVFGAVSDETWSEYDLNQDGVGFFNNENRLYVDALMNIKDRSSAGNFLEITGGIESAKGELMPVPPEIINEVPIENFGEDVTMEISGTAEQEGEVDTNWINEQIDRGIEQGHEDIENIQSKIANTKYDITNFQSELDDLVLNKRIELDIEINEYKTFLERSLLGREITGFGTITEENIEAAKELIKREEDLERIIFNYQHNKEYSDFDSFRDAYNTIRVNPRTDASFSPENRILMEAWQARFQIYNPDDLAQIPRKLFFSNPNVSEIETKVINTIYNLDYDENIDINEAINEKRMILSEMIKNLENSIDDNKEIIDNKRKGMVFLEALKKQKSVYTEE